MASLASHRRAFPNLILAVLSLLLSSSGVRSIKCYVGHFTCYPGCRLTDGPTGCPCNNETHAWDHQMMVDHKCTESHTTNPSTSDCKAGLTPKASDLKDCPGATQCKRVFVKPQFGAAKWGFHQFATLSCGNATAVDECVASVELRPGMSGSYWNRTKNSTASIDGRFQGKITSCCNTDGCNPAAPSRGLLSGAAIALGALAGCLSWWAH